MNDNTYFDTLDKSKCNGCGACALSCPVQAITMVEDSEGFLYPSVDESKCIKCNKCKNVCSNFPKYNDYQIRAYAARIKNDKEYMASTSGGMFKVFAKYVISNGGVVFGACFDENFEVIHDYAESMEDCEKFSRSKYVRSNLNNSFVKVKEFLDDDRYVLFSGTPCQCQGLRNFLGKDYEKLVLCEILCLANPSPKVLKMYLKNLELNYGKKIKNVFFRSKNPEMNCGPYAQFEDGTKVDISLYNKAFTRAKLFNRPSCSNCQFVDENRKSDFMMGDFWGVEKVFPDFASKNGVSLLTVNSEKASRIFELAKDNMEYREVDLKLAFSTNHHTNMPASVHRAEFFEGINSDKINESNIIEYIEKYM